MKNTNTKKLQKIELEMLKDFVAICRKYNLKYYLAYGTLIGAIRHSGFIPWDDDIDIHMPAEDYLKFQEIAQKEFKDKYFLQNFNTDPNYYQVWCKMRKNGTIMMEQVNEKMLIHQGIFIDIFPLIPYPKEKRTLKKFKIKYYIFKSLIEKNVPNKIVNYYGKPGKILHIIVKIFPKKLCLYLENKYFLQLMKADYIHNQYVSGGGLFPFPKKPFVDSTEVLFENGKFSVPQGYDELLSYLYGDYMKLPPENERINHKPIKIDFGDNK